MTINTSASIVESLRQAVLAAIPGAQVEVGANSPGHFQLRVVSPAFAGKSMMQQQQMVYAAIAALMRGDNAPVHAIDRLQTAVA
jgi:acid stress-induced BolA-like protein IbaG/YrbA